MIAARLNDMATQVILTNPPWRTRSRREDAERRNAVYPRLRGRVSKTYAANASENAKNINSLYDQYIQAIRMASDKLGNEGVIGFVSNNGWMNSLSASGLRACLVDEFAEVYVYDLRGDARTRGQNRKDEGGNPFGRSSRAGVCMLLLVKRPDHSGRGTVRRFTIRDGLNREQKLDLIKQHRDVNGTPWQVSQYEDWIGQTSDKFNALVPLNEVFGLSTFGMVSKRDAYIFNPSREDLERHTRRMIDTYNAHVARVKDGEITKRNIDERVEKDESLIKWDARLKNYIFTRGQSGFGTSGRIYPVLYRPFVIMRGHIGKLFVSAVYQTLRVHPTPDAPNLTLCVTAKGDGNAFASLVTRNIVDLNFFAPTKLYPLYVYNQPAPDEDSQGGGRGVSSRP